LAGKAKRDRRIFRNSEKYKGMQGVAPKGERRSQTEGSLVLESVSQVGYSELTALHLFGNGGRGGRPKCGCSGRKKRNRSEKGNSIVKIMGKGQKQAG